MVFKSVKYMGYYFHIIFMKYNVTNLEYRSSNTGLNQALYKHHAHMDLAHRLKMLQSYIMLYF